MVIKKLLKNKIIFYVGIFIISIFFFGYGVTSAATLQINSNSTTISVGDTVTLSIVLNSEGVAINNAEATVNFPSDLFDVVSLGKSGSIFSLWVEEPSFSNSSGLISFNGGLPTPGFNGSQGSVLSVILRAKKIGQASFIFSSAAVRANDGLGTDVLSNKQGKNITIIKKEEPVITPTPNSEQLSSLALQISSLTHSNQDQWYKEKNPVFKWSVPMGVNAVQTSISNNISVIPQVIYSPAINEKLIKDLEDGVWYFKARARKDGVWGPISTYIVRIDNTVPQKKNVLFTYNDSARTLNINADIQDLTSGINYYEIYINDILVKSVPAKEFINGNYDLKFNALGDSTVRLVAIDYAGNKSESTGTFHVLEISAPLIDPLPSNVSAGEQLLIRGKSQNSDTVIVYVKREDDEPIKLITKPSSDQSFFVLTPKLKSGNHDIWVEASLGDEIISSTHVYIEVTSQIIIGSFSMNLFLFVILILLFVSLLFLSVYFGYRFIKLRYTSSVQSNALKGNLYKTLFLHKKSLENNLAILKNISSNRILTEEENKIKENTEVDLKEINRVTTEEEK
jgi:hypothetical protein